MSFLSVLRLAFLSLSRNKTRSFLTTLGIIIGVGSVITMVGLGLGAYFSVQDEISKMGTSLLMVMPGSPSARGSMGPPGTMTNMTEEDAHAIESECPAVRLVSPIVRTSGQAIFTSQNWSSSVMGVGPNYLEVRNLKLTSGSFFTDRESRNGSKICVLGATVVKELFGGANPIGRSIRIKKMPFDVVGVLESRGQNSMGQDQDDVILAPLGTIQRRMMGITHLNMIMVSAVDDEMVDTAKTQIEKALRRRHKLLVTDNDDFVVRTQADIAAMAGSTLGIITLLLGSIASVSLLVGGIGIMNIMLVSVTERTREIGIRMAIGAKGRDILVQFLVEAVVLSCFGGVLGLAIGSGLIYLISYFSPWPAVISWPAAAGAFFFSALVGVFFGLYPAWKASKLDPIEALRFE